MAVPDRSTSPSTSETRPGRLCTSTTTRDCATPTLADERSFASSGSGARNTTGVVGNGLNTAIVTSPSWMGDPALSTAGATSRRAPLRGGLRLPSCTWSSLSGCAP